MKKINILLIIFIIFGLPSKAQYKFLGDAQYMKGGCIMLTPDLPYREGIAYYESKMSLSSYFEIEFDIYLGDKDTFGADGITFVLHNDDKQFGAFGTFGECLGYGRWSPHFVAGSYIAPSIAIEFDTYQNRAQNDPSSDHIAFLQNGTTFHETFWNNEDNEFNIEDDRLHHFSFRWEPDKQLITVYLDDYIVYQGRHDLINDVFDGNEELIWGFTASTGAKYNLQYFCLKRLAYGKDPSDNYLTSNNY